MRSDPTVTEKIKVGVGAATWVDTETDLRESAAAANLEVVAIAPRRSMLGRGMTVTVTGRASDVERLHDVLAAEVPGPVGGGLLDSLLNDLVGLGMRAGARRWRTWRRSRRAS